MLSPAAKEVLLQLFLKGPTWDGNIASKMGREELVDFGLVVRHSSWSILTLNGLRRSLELGYGKQKDPNV